jgi:hypothetical protein
MKRSIQFLIACMILISACADKPAYKTAKGKRKLRYYNAIQFGQKDVPKPKF